MRDADNAILHGVAIKTIRRWRRDYQRRGRPRGQEHLLARCPLCDGVDLNGAAYAELFGWYLGDGHISRQRRGVFGLHIFNDSRYAQLNHHVMDLMRQVKPKSRPHTRQIPRCTVITVSWKHWPCLFPQHGPGRKHERTLGMTEWQWMVAGQKKRYEYPRWQFTNESAEVMVWCRETLDLLDIAWRQSSRKTLSVSTRAGVARLDELIGPKT